MTKSIEITDARQVERINELATHVPYEVWLSVGPVMLDARSLLGLFSLIGKRVNVVADDAVSDRAFTKLVKKMV